LAQAAEGDGLASWLDQLHGSGLAVVLNEKRLLPTIGNDMTGDWHITARHSATRQRQQRPRRCLKVLNSYDLPTL
jgi:hypothetical protein